MGFVALLCPTLCYPVDGRPPGSSVHGDSDMNTEVNCLALLQGIFPTCDWIQVSCIEGRFFTTWGTREALLWGISFCRFSLKYFSCRRFLLGWLLVFIITIISLLWSLFFLSNAGHLGIIICFVLHFLIFCLLVLLHGENFSICILIWHILQQICFLIFEF